MDSEISKNIKMVQLKNILFFPKYLGQQLMATSWWEMGGNELIRLIEPNGSHRSYLLRWAFSDLAMQSCRIHL